MPPHRDVIQLDYWAPRLKHMGTQSRGKQRLLWYSMLRGGEPDLQELMLVSAHLSPCLYLTTVPLELLHLSS